MNEAVEWGTIAQWVSPAVAILIALWAAFSRHDEKALDELRADRNTLFARVDDLEADVAAIKTNVEHLPTVGDVHEVKLAVAALNAMIGTKFEAIADKIDTIISQSERAQERLARREDEIIQRLKER